MTLRVPLTLTIIPALTVSIAGQHFAIPRSAIEEIVRANGESVTLEHLGGAGVATIRGRRVPEVSLADILGLESEVDEQDRTLDRAASGRRRRLCAVGRSHPRSRGAGGEARRSGGDGDRPLCRNDAGRRRQPDPAVRPGGARAGRRGQARSAGARRRGLPKVRRRLARSRRRCCCSAASTAAAARFASRWSTGSRKCRVERRQGGRWPASGPGRRSDPAARRRSRRASLATSKVRLFRLNDGAHEIGYAFAEVIDFATIDNDVIHAERPGEVSGVSLINGEPAELVDAHWLFANHVGAAARTTEQLGLPPAERRSVDAEHASPDRRSCGLSRGRRRA